MSQRIARVRVVWTALVVFFLGNPAVGLCQTKEAADQTFPPHSTATYFNLAIAYYSEGRIGEAASALEKLLELDPSDVEAAYNLGCLALRLGETERARASFQQAKRFSGKSPSFVPLIQDALVFLRPTGRARS